MKPSLKIGIAAVAVSLVFAAGYAKGQNQTEKLTGSEFERIEAAAQDEPNSDSFAALSSAYQKAPESDEAVRSIVTTSLSANFRGKTNDTGMIALQVMQNQKLIKQNERIIQLLEQQQKAK